MKRMFIIMITILFLLCFYGCDIPKKEKEGFEVGFDEARNDWRASAFVTGMKSDKRIFNIDEVYIDFYFGMLNASKHINKPNYQNDNKKFIGIVAYFYIRGYEKTGRERFEDYKNIEGHYLIKEYEWEELIVKEKEAVYTSGFLALTGKTEFGYHETFKIPKEMFEYTDENEGKINFGIASVIKFIEKEKTYYGYEDLGTTSDTCIMFARINDNQIKILNDLYY